MRGSCSRGNDFRYVSPRMRAFTGDGTSRRNSETNSASPAIAAVVVSPRRGRMIAAAVVRSAANTVRRVLNMGSSRCKRFQPIREAQGQRNDGHRGVIEAVTRKHRTACNKQVLDSVDSAVFIDNAVTGLPMHTGGTHVVMGIQDIMLRIDVQSSQAGTAELTGKDLRGRDAFFHRNQTATANRASPAASRARRRYRSV